MTATLELPKDINLSEGEPFSLSIEGVAHNGKLVVREMRVHPARAGSVGATGMAGAVDDFLAFAASLPAGPLSNASDEELDEARYQHLMEKHLR